MTPVSKLSFEFVDFIPEQLDDGVLYIAGTYATAVHKCCCGCGSEVVTPFSPTDWKLSYDGESVSLSPSVGNWSFACQSHYWIQRNTVRWAPQMSREEIEAGRQRDRLAKMQHYGAAVPDGQEVASARSENLFAKLWRWMRGA